MQTERLLNEAPCKQTSLFADSLLEVSSEVSPGVSSGRFLERSSESSAESSAERSAEVSSQAAQRRYSGSLDHLAAAQRLAKKLRNGRRKPRTSKRAGIAICQHLIALLHEGEKHEGEKHEGEKHEGEIRQREMSPRMHAQAPRSN